MFARSCVATITLVAVFILGGCAAKSVKSDFSLDPSRNEGVIVVSVSHDDEGGRGTRAIIYLNGSLLTDENAKLLQSLPDIAFGIHGRSDLEDGYGQVLALALPAGHHELRSWQIAQGQIRLRPSETTLSLGFDLASGEIKYLGNLHAHMMYGKNIFGMTILGDGYFELRDLHERDIAIFEGKYPQFKGKAAVALLPVGPWLSGDGTRRQIDSPLLLPPPRVKK